MQIPCMNWLQQKSHTLYGTSLNHLSQREKMWKEQGEAFPRTDKILQKRTKTSVIIEIETKWLLTHIASDSYFDREKKFCCKHEVFVWTLKRELEEVPRNRSFFCRSLSVFCRSLKSRARAIRGWDEELERTVLTQFLQWVGSSDCGLHTFLYFCHPVLRINTGDSLLLSKSLTLLDLISPRLELCTPTSVCFLAWIWGLYSNLSGRVDICSWQNFFSLLWFLVCLLRPLVSSLNKCRAQDLIQVILFFHFTFYHFLRLEL